LLFPGLSFFDTILNQQTGYRFTIDFCHTIYAYK